jgi:cytochrome P450
MLAELEDGSVHRGWPEMGIPASPRTQQIFSVYSFDAVKAVFTDNKTSARAVTEAIVRPFQGPTILEMQEPEHAVYRRLHEFAFARSSMRRWGSRSGPPLVERTVDRFREAKRPTWSKRSSCRSRSVIAALIGLPESDIPEFHRLAIDLLGFHPTWTAR